MRYLPDTNILIAALNAEDNVKSALNALKVLVTDDNALLDNSVPGLIVQNWRR